MVTTITKVGSNLTGVEFQKQQFSFDFHQWKTFIILDSFVRSRAWKVINFKFAKFYVKLRQYCLTTKTVLSLTVEHATWCVNFHSFKWWHKIVGKNEEIATSLTVFSAIRFTPSSNYALLTRFFCVIIINCNLACRFLFLVWYLHHLGHFRFLQCNLQGKIVEHFIANGLVVFVYTIYNIQHLNYMIILKAFCYRFL